MAERKNRRNGRPVATKQPPDGFDGTSAGDTTALARDLAQGDQQLALENLRSVAGRGPAAASRATTQTLAAAGQSDVTDEIDATGTAFGNFVKSVGLAVATAQTELDRTLRDTAKALSEQTIDVIAVWEQVLSDDTGEMQQGNPKVMKLPLINYLMPTAYHWSRIYLEADMKVSEFNSDHGFRIQQTAHTANANVNAKYGLSGFGVSGGASYGYSNTNTNVHSSSSVDTAAGSMHMEATLEPRADIQLPKPYLVQKGPRLNVSIVSVTDTVEEVEKEGKKEKYVKARTAVLQVELKKSNGAANADKTVEFSVDQPLINYSASSLKTDAKGMTTITLTRNMTPADAGKPVNVGVRVWFGFVTSEVGVQM